MGIYIKKLVKIDIRVLETISMWMYEWWGKNEGYSYDKIKSYMQHGLQDERLPHTYGLFLDDNLIGIYQIRLDDLFVRPDIYPWLANVYIDVPYRGKGYGKFIMESVRTNAKKCLIYNEIYLYTTHVGLYEKYGWEFISEIDTHLDNSRIQRLYRLNLE